MLRSNHGKQTVSTSQPIYKRNNFGPVIVARKGIVRLRVITYDDKRGKEHKVYSKNEACSTFNDLTHRDLRNSFEMKQKGSVIKFMNPRERNQIEEEEIE